MKKVVISTKKAPGAIGPYSQAIKIGDTIYTSGQLGIDVKTGEFGETVGDQATLALDNVRHILEEAGSSMDNIIKSLVFLSDMEDFDAVNNVYKEYFSSDFPARSAVEVSRLPKDAKIEIEVIAYM